MRSETIKIAGAGLAGLTAAISLARGGHKVVLYEKNSETGENRNPDWDAIENWTTELDFMHLLPKWGVRRDFDIHATREFMLLDNQGDCYPVSTAQPFFYLVRRGPQPGTIDQALKDQALDAGVTIHYNQPRAREEVDIWAAGSQRNGFFLGIGLTFRTKHPDTVMALVSSEAAPKAYAYLVILNGLGKLSVFLTQNYRAAREHLNQAVEIFRRLKYFEMEEVQISAGFSGLPGEIKQQPGQSLAVGEAAGFQDFLWGFGIRQALLSGHLAARALHEEKDYSKMVAREIRPLVRSSIVNRMLYDLAGDQIYRAFIRRFSGSPNLLQTIRGWYRGQVIGGLLWPIAYRRYQERLVYLEKD
jgi:flavin-dependent dehydrogenase